MTAPDNGQNRPVGIGLIGAGDISDTYLENLTSFADLNVLAIGDIRLDAARRRSEEFGVELHGGSEVVLRHPEIEIVVNLTWPRAHAEVASAAIAAGKHVWNEKPLVLDRAVAAALLEQAQAAGVRIGAAPDTFLGSGLQAARRLIDEGAIGMPLTALTLMQGNGPEGWHPDPVFFYAPGGGPLFDMGPYYVTTLIQMLGPVAQAYGIGSTARQQRLIGSGLRAGEVFEVTVPTHVGAMLRFESGASSQSIFSFDSAHGRNLFEINGTEGTIAVPDPNTFDGAVRIKRPGSEDWHVVVETVARSSRGTGVLEMARALRADVPHRASGALGFHVLDTMQAISESVESGQPVDVLSTVERPDLLPEDWDCTRPTV